MPLPHNALVLVADGRKMLFFRNHGDEEEIDGGEELAPEEGAVVGESEFDKPADPETE